MRRQSALAGALILTAALAAPQTAFAKGETGDMIVHEWGTFLTMNGSDGITLDGMYHEEHALPSFVHSRSNDQLHIRSAMSKGETPVIYFYTKKKQNVRIAVDFPSGVWTQWYPEVGAVRPTFSELGDLQHPKNGRICWNAEILPVSPGSANPTLPKTASDALWNYARDVDAAYVRTVNRTPNSETNEYERFLFYRGLGQSPMPLGVKFNEGGTLSLGETSRVRLNHLFILRVENGKGVSRYIPSLSPGEKISEVIPEMDNAQPLETFTRRISDELAGRLVESGLYPKEARAMVNTWKNSYFQSDGIRVLYILPQSWTEATIPMHLSPQPSKLVRVMVGRTELLTPEREAKMEAAVKALAATDSTIQERGFTFLRAQGRYVEPMLRRTLATATDEQTRKLCQKLLVTDWVTELRATLRAASNGAEIEDDPVKMREELAVLLREMGQ